MVACWGLAALERPAHALTPDSPQVVESIEKGLGYLQTSASTEIRLGGKCLIGLCFYKNRRPISHPLIQEATEYCRSTSKNLVNESVYSLGLAVIYLCELETEQPQLRDLAQTYLNTLLKRQKPHGGWGYEGMKTGDTSQTQYAALALWMASKHGHDVPGDAIERLCGWLVRTQDPSGTWAYQGNDPGGYQRINQSDQKRLSLHVAGAGSIYIAADLLGLNRVPETGQESKLPPALRAVGQEDEAKAPKRATLKMFDPQLVRKSMSDADQFMTKNYDIAPKEQLHYYLYGLERYQSYKELAAGRPPDPEPKWYNDGAAHLLATQNGQGLWVASGDTHIISTCFAILFLSRSAGKSIGKIEDLGQGVLLGGMGLPPNTADLAERDGKLVETPLAGSIDELLAVIEKPNPELDQLIDPTQPLKLDGDVTKRSGQITRLRALVGSGDYNTRLLAVRTLGRARELDNVPVMIYALTDPDPRIVREADRALRFLSRKFEGVGLPDQPTPQDIETAAKAWKAWYKSVRPEAEFLD